MTATSLDGTREPSPQRHAVLSTTPSDSHTWNLLFLQLLMEENGWSVTNLGACVPVPLLVNEAIRNSPDLVVISTVNGHGAQEGFDVINGLRAAPSLLTVPVVIGGKLGVSDAGQRENIDELLAAGYDSVLVGDDALSTLRTLLGQPLATPMQFAK